MENTNQCGASDGAANDCDAGAFPPAPGSAVLAIAAVQLSKLTPFPGGHTTSHTMTLHHRAGVADEDQMRGIAVREAMELKPGFSVDQVLVTFASLPNAVVSQPRGQAPE